MVDMVGSGISWQKLKETEDGLHGELLKPRNVVDRHSTNRTNRRVNVRIENNAPLHRPRTTFGFEDYFDDTENDRKRKALNIKRNLQELKRVTLAGSTLPHRNCISALDEKYFDSKSRGRKNIYSDQTSEKLKSFRALISPPPYGQTRRHSASHQERANILSNGVEVNDSFIKFKAMPSDCDTTGSAPTGRTLNELQLTYELDKERARNKTRTGSFENPHTDIFNGDCVVVVINNLCTSPEHQSRDISDRTHDRQLNELQLTYDEDRLKRQGHHNINDTCDNSTGTSPVGFSQQARNSNSVKTNASRYDATRIIKRPVNNTVIHDRVRSNVVPSPRSQDLDRHHDFISATSCEHQDTLHFSMSLPFGHEYLRSNDSPLLEVDKKRINGTVHDNMKNNHTISLERSVSVPVTHSQSAATKHQHAIHYDTPGSSISVCDTSLQENNASQPLPVTASPAHLICLPGTGVDPGALIKTHLNALGTCLSTLSRKLNEQPHPNIQNVICACDAITPPSLVSVLGGRPQDLVIQTNSENGQHSGSSVVTPDVHTLVRVNHQLHNLSSTSNSTPVLRDEPDHSSQHGTTSEPTLDPMQTSWMDTNESLKQTNVKGYGIPQNCNASIIHNTRCMSTKTDSRNISFRAESPRQTNISLESDLLSSSFYVEPGRNVQQGQGTNCRSKHKDNLTNGNTRTKQRKTFDGGSDLSHSSDTSNASYINQKKQLGTLEERDSVTAQKYSEGVGDGRSLDVRHRNTNRSPLSENLNTQFQKQFSSHIHKVVIPGNCDQTSCEDGPQKAHISTINPEATETNLMRKLVSNIYTNENTVAKRNGEGQRSRKGHYVNVTTNKILAKRPIKMHSERPAVAVNGKHEKLKVERSKSALDIVRNKYNNLCLSDHDLHEGKRPQSSLATTYSSSRHMERLKDRQTQQYSNVTKKLESSGNRTVQLGKKVHLLHEEVLQRLKSRDNIIHGANSSELLKGVSNHRTERSIDELSDVSTIIDASDCNRAIKATSKISSLFATSTPVKITSTHVKVTSIPVMHTNKYGKVNATQDVGLSPKTTNALPVKDSRKNDLKVENHMNIRENKSQTPRDRHISDNYLADRLKKIISARNTAAPDSITFQPPTKDDGDKDSVLVQRQPSLTGGYQQRSEISKRDFPNHTGHLTGVLDPDAVSQTHTTPSGHPLATRQQNKDISNHGRASPADSLLSHLDNPNIVMLLQKLYKADHATRQIIMTKVEFFRAWQFYTVSSREYRARKKTLAQKSITYCVHRLLFYHFGTWHIRASNSRKMRQANALCRFHILTKGLNALRWSVIKSKHLTQKLQATVHALMLTASFRKWKTAAETQRRGRLETAVKQWRQYVSETQKIRRMKEVMEGNVMMDVLRCWKHNYNKREKRNVAFSLFRKTLMRQAFASWRLYFSWCKDKKERYSFAVSHHQYMTMKSNFHKVVVSFSKAQTAKAHLRRHQFSKVFRAWAKVTETCKMERQTEMAESRHHWEKQTLKQYIATWKDKLVTKHAAKMADFKICRKTFFVWKQAWEANVTRYLAIEATMMRNKLHHALLTWSKHVIQQQRRHALAVSLIENCYLKYVWKSWRFYMAAKGVLKRRAQLHQVANQHKILTSYFSQWQASYHRCRQEKLTQQLWSEDCARRFALRWKLICYRRSLLQLFELTQPDREHRLMRAMFVNWMSSLDRRRLEMKQADDLHKDISQSHLRLIFHFWKLETRRVLTIKPLLHRRQEQIFLGCFDGWRDFIQRKSKCKHIQRSFQIKLLQKSFFSWRRQYHACQTEKKIKKKVSQGLLLCFLQEWWFLIYRKKKGKDFNTSCVQHRAFYVWRYRATVQRTRRVIILREEEGKMMLKKKYFSKWLENAQAQVSMTDLYHDQFVQKQNTSVLMQTFNSWRRQIQSICTARAYQKSQDQRLLLTLFLAWQELANSSASEAIHRFSEKIGLMTNAVQEIKSKSSMVIYSSSCTLESSFLRLVNESDERQETDVDRMSLLSAGLQVCIDDHRSKCQRLKDTVTVAIHRLKHWPICVVFDQWKDFTVRERILKTLYHRLKAVHIRVETSLAFRDWRSKFLATKTAQVHRNEHLLSASVRSLSLYRNHRKYVKHLNNLACQHHKMVAVSKFFSLWLLKTQAQLKEKHVLHLWTSCTPQETEIMPLEKHLRQKLNRRSLSACFVLWLLQYQAVNRLRKVYHRHILSWVFSTWREWARNKHDRVMKSFKMLQQRRTRMTFDLWLRRLNQSQETNRRHQEAWQNYLLLILQEWRYWTTASRSFHLSSKQFDLQQSQRHLLSYFSRWKTLTIKVKEIRNNLTHRLMYSVFHEWRRTVKQNRKEKQTIYQFQILSYTLLVKRLFHKWRAGYTRHMLSQQEKRHYAEKCARAAAVVWKRKAQKTRGHRLEILLLRRKLASHFQHWKTSLSNIQCLYDTLDKMTLLKNLCTIRQHFRIWRTQLIADQARKVHVYRFVHVVFAEWQQFTKASKQRQVNCLTMKRTVQKRRLHVTFQYWLTLTKVKQSVQQNMETRLQIRALRSWQTHTRKMTYMRTCQEQLSLRVKTRIICTAFTNMRWKAEYCASLQEIADNVAKDKIKTTLRTLFDVWKDTLNTIIAARCYKHILAVRVARRWRRFIQKRKLLLLRDAENWKKAVEFHHRQISKRAFAALKMEVLVRDLVQRRRQRFCLKYAKLWKLKLDMHFTSITLEYEFVRRRSWNRWRMELMKIRATNQVNDLLQRQLLSQVFHSWRGLCQKVDVRRLPHPSACHDRKVPSPLSSATSSMIPIPVSYSTTLSTSSSILPSSGNKMRTFKSGRRV